MFRSRALEGNGGIEQMVNGHLIAKFEPEKKIIIKTQHTQHYRDSATKGKRPISKQSLCL